MIDTCYEFVTLRFEGPQTVLHLPKWHWPTIGTYNGFTGAARIRGWQLLRFYQLNGWLSFENVCSVTGCTGSMQLHSEDYLRPYNAYPISRRTHAIIHARFRFPGSWDRFLSQEALPGTWARHLSVQISNDLALADYSADALMLRAPHPPWVIVPCEEFYTR